MKNIEKKWTILIVATFVTFFGIGYTLLKGTQATSDDVFGVEEQRRAIVGVADAYYRQGVQLQYDSYKKNLYSTPEDATNQHYTYTVCSGFTFQVYYQTLGIKIPDTTDGLLKYAKANKNNSAVVLAYYGTEDEIYSESVLGTEDVKNFSNFTKQWSEILQPGDIIVVTGHAMMVYSVNKEEKKVTLIESVNGARYDHEEHTDRFDENGTIAYNDLEARLQSYYNSKFFIKQMAIIRFITDGKNYIYDEEGNVDTYTITDSAISRLKYSNIDIEKTMVITENNGDNISQNNLVNLGEYLTYNLTITNNSQNVYSNLNVIENIDSNLVLIDNGDGQFVNGKLKWEVSSLDVGESISLSYIVLVPLDKQLFGKIIVSTGYVDNIATSRIETLIGNKLNAAEKEKINLMYNSLKDNNQVEREFINQLYFDAFGLELGLSSLGNLDIIGYDANITSNGKEVLAVKRAKVKETSVKKYIYQNFYGLRLFNGVLTSVDENRDCPESSLVRSTLQWNIYPTYELNDRARTLTFDMLTDGDIILLYTADIITPTDSNRCPVEELENRAYIFLNNKLIRKISSNEFEEISGDELTKFLRDIIGENYIILRPSLFFGNMYNDIDNFVTDNENKYIKFLNVGTKVSEFFDLFSEDKFMSLYNKNGDKKALDDVINTGDILKYNYGDKVIDGYIISVLGDSSGDGRFSIIDVAQLRKHLVKWKNDTTGTIFEMKGVYKDAFDFSKDGKISIVDLAIMRKKLVGLI